MALNIPVKAGAISNLTDARFFAAFEVDMLGFCFDPQSENYISPQEAIAIAGWISGPKIVAEFANQDEENVVSIIDFMQVDIVQLSADYSKNFIQSLQQKVQLILDLTDAEEKLISELLALSSIQYFVVTEKQFIELELLLDKNVIVVIDSHLNKQYPAIQLNGTTEKSTGIKMFEREGEILDSLVK